MPFAAVCPDCDAKAKVPDQLAGKKIKCPKCGTAYIAKAPVEDDEDDRPVKAKSRRPVDEDEDEPRRPVKSKRPVDDDDEEAPRPKKKVAVDDDEDDEPKPKKKKKKKKKKQGMPVGVLVGIIAGVLVLIGGGIGAAIYFGGDKEDTTVAQGSGTAPNTPNAGKAPVAKGPTLVDTSAWVEHVDAEGRFRIKFPAQPTQRNQTAQGPMGPQTIRVVMLDRPNEAFLCLHQALPENRAGITDDQLLDLAIQQGVGGAKGGQATNITSIEYQGYKGREATMSVPGKKGMLIMRVILAKDRIIGTFSGGDNASATDPTIRAFFSSLQIE